MSGIAVSLLVNLNDKPSCRHDVVPQEYKWEEAHLVVVKPKSCASCQETYDTRFLLQTPIHPTCNLTYVHPYAEVLAMFAFDSSSQSKRSPRPLFRHRPCKTPFPIGNATFNKVPRFYLKWFFSLIHNGTPVSYSPSCQELLRAQLRPAL